jgi:hypothetical protein
VSEYGFDIHSSLSGRTYHITDSDAGAQMWIDLIHAMVEKQSEEAQQTKRTIEAVWFDRRGGRGGRERGRGDGVTARGSPCLEVDRWV